MQQKRTEIRNGLLQRLLELESEIVYRSGPLPGEMDFCYQPGKLPLLITAPHGAAHCRAGRLKDEDEFTSGMARLVAEKTGAQTLYVNFQSENDHNYDRETPFKEMIRSLAGEGKVHFVLDLHGASDRHPFGIALGMMGGISCPAQADTILAVLADYGYSPGASNINHLDVDNHFKGGGGPRQETITQFSVSQLSIPAAQLELNAKLRIVYRGADNQHRAPYSGNPENIYRTIQMLITLVNQLSESL
jgi:hypothetical protein